MARSRVFLVALLAVCALSGGCAGTPVSIPPDLRPAVASAPVKPIDALPKHVSIPSIGVDATVVGIGLDSSNGLEITPLNAHPEDVGWYIYGPPPGVAGPALMASHINWDHHPGAFANLSKVKVGDKISITRSDGSVLRFTTTRVGSVLKSKFESAGIYNPTPDAELRLVTCGGQYDAAHRNYLSNSIVWALLDKS